MEVYQEEWREVFIVAAEVYLFGACIYLILGDGKKQWWADGVGLNASDSKLNLHQSSKYDSIGLVSSK